MLKDAEALNRGKYYCTEQQTLTVPKKLKLKIGYR